MILYLYSWACIRIGKRRGSMRWSCRFHTKTLSAGKLFLCLMLGLAVMHHTSTPMSGLIPSAAFSCLLLFRGCSHQRRHHQLRCEQNNKLKWWIGTSQHSCCWGDLNKVCCGLMNGNSTRGAKLQCISKGTFLCQTCCIHIGPIQVQTRTACHYHVTPCLWIENWCVTDLPD